MDLHEDSDKNVVSVTVELPGVKKKDVHLEVRNGQLTVSAETKDSVEDSEGGYVIRERRFGKFSRSLRLPEGVKVRILWNEMLTVSQDEIKAEMADGVLSIMFPQSLPEQAPKKISISWATLDIMQTFL